TLDMLAAVDGSRSRAPLRLTRAFETRVIELDGGVVRFTHPLLGSVLYAEATAAERADVHRRLACVARDPEESARHLALAATGPDAAIAMSLDEAAVTVRRRGAPDGAADLVVRAIELTPPGDADELRRRRLEAAADSVAAGDLQRAGKLLDAALASSAPGSERAEALARLGWVRAHGTSWVEGANLFAETLGERGVLAEALADRAFIAMLRGESHYRSTMDRALELERDDGWRQIIGRAQWLNALILAWSDDLDGARVALDLLLAEAIARGDEHALPY